MALQQRHVLLALSRLYGNIALCVASLICVLTSFVYIFQGNVIRWPPRAPYFGKTVGPVDNTRIPDYLSAFKTAKSKKILFWTPFWTSYRDWPHFFNAMTAGECPVSNCDLTFDADELDQADAVVFHLIDLYWSQNNLPSRRPAGQIWILFCLESPAYPQTRIINTTVLNGVFNWTMSYRWDSDIPVPYGLVLPRNSLSEAARQHVLPEAVRRSLPLRPQLQRSLSRPKTKLVAWMASNCDAPSRRSDYVRELQMYIPVDVYGACGPLTCGQRESVKRQEDDSNSVCEVTMASYRFYLAFENALCPDYVTEKFFRTLTLGVVPVVMGGAQYSKLAPDGSFIDAMRYRPRQLAQLLLYLESNNTAYEDFFLWKESYDIVSAHPMRPLTCGLCRRLHEVTPGSFVGTHEELDRWFSASQCLNWSPNLWR
ncbi:alpha-(1,3)-fucosyltransferase 7-like [Pollicipes pollicipes]|uniref:alpha-(1,3)-fucosyltransferase 7-like n=1 Tax=Pollicipes pollicipes TaxID=41117 RepID=UPI0018855E1E|nr:alpha-(1,3)-fucosyltransferase 7-like [Pollicipes pollicipes]